MPPSIPDGLAPLVERIVAGLPGLLGAELVGIYLYGSLLEPGFVPGRSDVDCIAVTERPLDAPTFDRLGHWFASALGEDPRFARLQMSLLVRDRVLEDDPAACLYQFGVLRRSGSDGNPIIWLDHFQRGRTLLGPDAASFVPAITPALLHEALVREVGYLREEISLRPDGEWRDRPSYRAYAVMTLCRILHTDATGDVTSKAHAAERAIERTPPEHHGLIRSAGRVSDDVASEELPLPAIERLIRHVQSEIDRHVPEQRTTGRR